jgi:hypothetical protein
MRWEGQEAHLGERRGGYRVLGGKPEEQRPLVRPRHRWEIILECILKKLVGKMWTGWICLRIRKISWLL